MAWIDQMNVEQGFSHADALHRHEVADDVDAPPTRRRRWIIVAAIAIVAAVAVLIMVRSGKPAAPEAPALPHVSVIVPGRQAVTGTVAATGSLAARRDMPVGVAGEGGIVSRVLVEPGDWVRAGQVLATIDRSVQVQEGASLNASIAVARADANVAQSELDRAQKLVARGFISRADIERKTATRDAARARVRVAQAQYGESVARTGRLDIRAPAAGLVLTRALEAGQVVSSGSMSPLFRIARDGEMELAARVAEQDLAGLRVGMPAEVTPVGTQTPIRGSIWQLSPIVDPQTRQGVARVALKYDPALRPGGFAAVRIASGSVDAPLLPESAVQSDDKGNYVYVVGPNDKVVRRTVTVGQVSDAGIAVLSGLEGNERIVLSAGAFLNPGDKVVPERVAARR